MADRVKGITIQIGGDTTGLSKALSGVNKEIKSTQSQLKDVERLLKIDPGNTELLAQKQKLLSQEIGATENKLQGLKKAEQQVQAQFQRGDIGEEQYNALKREIIATENNLKGLKEESQKAKKQIDNIDENPIKEVSEAAKDAEKALEDAGESASSFSDYLKADALIEGVKGIAGALKDASEESKEYRKIMGSLEISSQKAGYSASETANSYRTLYGVLADDQTAATTTANLQALQLSQEKLNQLINGAIGAWATYGDSIPIDGLSEAINETAQVGIVTGTFADVLNWAGISEDDFNTKLSECGTSAQRADLILKQLASQGLVQAGEAWQENNKSLVESNEASARFQDQMAQLGEKIEPIFTKITDAVSSLLEWFNNLDEGTQDLILAAGGLVIAIIAVASAVGVLSTAMSILAANPIVLAIAAVVAGIVLLIVAIKGLIDNWDAVSQAASDCWDAICNAFAQAGDWIYQNVIKPVVDFFTGMWEMIKYGADMAWWGIQTGLLSMLNFAIDCINKFLEIILTPINWIIKLLNLIPGVDIGEIKAEIPKFELPEMPTPPKLAAGGRLSRGSAIVGEAGPELLTVSGGKTTVTPLDGRNAAYNPSAAGAIYIDQILIPAKDVREFNDIIRIVQGTPQIRRARGI